MAGEFRRGNACIESFDDAPDMRRTAQIAQFFKPLPPFAVAVEVKRGSGSFYSVMLGDGVKCGPCAGEISKGTVVNDDARGWLGRRYRVLWGSHSHGARMRKAVSVGKPSPWAGDSGNARLPRACRKNTGQYFFQGGVEGEGMV